MIEKIRTGMYGTNGVGRRVIHKGEYEIDGQKAYNFLRKHKFKIRNYLDGEKIIAMNNRFYAEWNLGSDAGGWIAVRLRRKSDNFPSKRVISDAFW